MVTLLASFGLDSKSTSCKPEHLGSLKIAVLGSSGCGKSSFIQLLTSSSSGKPKPTQGCSVHVVISRAGAGVQEEAKGDARDSFFVELWDISCHPNYKDLRRLFYQQLSGVILVHDLSDPSSHNHINKLAQEVAQEGTFVAPLSEEAACHNLGGIPVPVLVVGMKSDLSRKQGKGVAAAQPVKQKWFASASCRLSLRRRGSEGKLSEGSASPVGLQASFKSRSIDRAAVHSYFYSLWTRRYKPSSQFCVPSSWSPISNISNGYKMGMGDVPPENDDRIDSTWV